MSMTLSVRFEHRNFARVTGQRRHDLRIGDQPKYVYGPKTKDNRVLIEPQQPTALRKMCESYRSKRETKRAMKVSAAVGSHFILTFGSEAHKVILALNESDKEKLDALTMLAAIKLAERLNVDLTGLVLHLDESSPHYHGQMPAVNRDGIPLSKVITSEVATELQDISGSVFEPVTGIKRGKHKAKRIDDDEDESAYIHRSVKQLHEDLPRDIEVLKHKQAELIEALAINNARTEAARAKAAKAEADEKATAENVEKLKNRAENYESRAEAKQKELDEIEATLDRLRGLLPEPTSVAIKKTEKRQLKESAFSAAQQVEVVIASGQSEQKYYKAEDINAVLFQAKRENENKIQEIKDENKRIIEENTRLNKKLDDFAEAERVVMFERLGGKTVIEVAQEIKDAQTPPEPPEDGQGDGQGFGFGFEFK